MLPLQILCDKLGPLNTGDSGVAVRPGSSSNACLHMECTMKYAVRILLRSGGCRGVLALGIPREEMRL